ncbi:hypothetical protein L228DRAFT_266062 [Xylona heveae TC161]|uniref:Xylanolytic transcriptional activator regulatory domain-containing protein n=1 Tax=Xylona heveae (strain CBS 132557 / TC161) TaxID=1328760 RepID=A0A165J002_XYLHT|nr:hypothetical protein L228DRAFT_266062 [Xylona heveae TC161]KZF25602.1 hypothetical protein L228DRAFT_266062 [Xylona heveae TC161]
MTGDRIARIYVQLVFHAVEESPVAKRTLLLKHLRRTRKTNNRAKTVDNPEQENIELNSNVNDGTEAAADLSLLPSYEGTNPRAINTSRSPTSPVHLMDNENNANRHLLSNFTSSFAGAEEEDSHIIGPAMAVDSEILENYLSTVLDNGSTLRMIRTSSKSNTSSQHARPTMFTTARRRPLGLLKNQNPTSNKCEMVEKLVEPHLQDLVDLYFGKVNICFPLLDERSFKKLFSENKEKISPALLSNLYTNSMIYWRHSPLLSRDRCPDIRFCWLQSCEALHSELFLSPGTSAIITILLNIGGRPSTSVFGNAGLLGTAVALSHALGLNRDPTEWDISSLEKRLRIRIWWALVIHDRWYSLAYGTPPQIHRSQHDVPIPTIRDLCTANTSSAERLAASVFISLTTLTEVLGRYLEYLYDLEKDQRKAREITPSTLELLLSHWERSLDAVVCKIVLHGYDLDAPGAANLRLAYLATRLLLRRIQLDLDKQVQGVDEEAITHRYIQAEKAAEDIVHFAQALNENHLTGFWIPTSAFSLTSATTLLLRSALRAKNFGPGGPLAIAKDMICTLQSHHRKFGWDLADNCLGQYADIIEKICPPNGDVYEPSLPDFEQLMMFDFPGLDDLFPNIWDFPGI